MDPNSKSVNDKCRNDRNADFDNIGSIKKDVTLNQSSMMGDESFIHLQQHRDSSLLYNEYSTINEMAPCNKADIEF